MIKTDVLLIGAGAVVVKDIISDNGCTAGGIPAKIISNNTSELNLIKATDIVNKEKFYI